MILPAAIKELEKLELIRRLDDQYCLDYAVTANQKAILKAFGMDVKAIKEKAARHSMDLKQAKGGGVKMGRTSECFTASGKSYDEILSFLKG